MPLIKETKPSTIFFHPHNSQINVKVPGSYYPVTFTLLCPHSFKPPHLKVMIHQSRGRTVYKNWGVNFTLTQSKEALFPIDCSLKQTSAPSKASSLSATWPGLILFNSIKYSL